MRAILVASLFLVACAAPSPGPQAVAPVQSSREGTLGASCSDAGTATVQKVARAGNVQTVRVAAMVIASEDESPKQARTRATTKARHQAVESVGGVRVKSSLVAFEQESGSQSNRLIQELIFTRVEALVVNTRFLEEWQPGGYAGAGYCYGVVLELEVLDRSDQANSDFEVDLSLESERLVAGDSVRVTVESNQDARVYLLGMSQDGSGALLLPNGFRKDTRVKAGERLVFPDPRHERDGVRLEAQVPKGQTQVTEYLVAIAIRGAGTLAPRARKDRKGSVETAEATAPGTTLQDYIRALQQLPADQWAFDQVAYQIWAR